MENFQMNALIFPVITSRDVFISVTFAQLLKCLGENAELEARKYTDKLEFCQPSVAFFHSSLLRFLNLIFIYRFCLHERQIFCFWQFLLALSVCISAKILCVLRQCKAYCWNQHFSWVCYCILSHVSFWCIPLCFHMEFCDLPVQSNIRLLLNILVFSWNQTPVRLHVKWFDGLMGKIWQYFTAFFFSIGRGLQRQTIIRLL